MIVESPAKARTIERYLGSDYQVLASYGHVRDLPENPGKGKLGVDVDHNFEPEYVVPDDRKRQVSAIEKAVMESDLGLTPSNDGNVIRLQIPELTEERRKELVKVVHGVAEQGRVAVRNIRRDVMHDLRELKSEGEVGSDDEHRAESELQKLTDAHVGEIDTALAGKEQEILEV